MCLILSISKELLLSIWQEVQSVQIVYATGEIRKMVYANTQEVDETKGYRCLIDGLAGESRALREHTSF